MDHLDLPLILGHEYINIAIQRVTMILGTYDLEYPWSLATHVMKMRKKIESVQTVDT